MKPRGMLTLVALVLFSAAGAGTASAQGTPGADRSIAPYFVEVSFGFAVAGKSLPAGRYEVESPVPGLVVFREAKTKVAVESPVVTRLARSGNSQEDGPRIVFDKVGDSYTASEVWFKDVDGFLVGSTKEAHTHVIVKTQAK
jgi:hypothetical protein